VREIYGVFSIKSSSAKEDNWMADGKESFSGRVTVWVAIASSIVTIVLTGFNYVTKAKVDLAHVQVEDRAQAVDRDIRARSASVQKSQERTSRYTFVHTLFPELLDPDAQKKELSINLIRLALSDDEASKLFSGFSNSNDEQLKAAGKSAIAIITNVKNAASEEERKGFQALIDGNYDQAIAAFKAAENAYPGYHQVYEIARLISARRQDLNDPSKRKAVLQQIVVYFSWEAPADLLDQLKKAAQ
jgi:hypothetical protein